MKRLNLNPGDMFCVDTNGFLSTAINTIQGWWADDKKSVYNHAGLIINGGGQTLESLSRVCNKNIYTNYRSCKILIARHRKMNQDLFDYAIPLINKYKDDKYPFYRLFLHMIPSVAAHVNTFDKLVCSELVAKFLFECKLKKQYLGINVDNLSDMFHNKPQTYKIVFEGKLTDNNQQ